MSSLWAKEILVILVGVLATTLKGKEGLKKSGLDSEPSAFNPLCDLSKSEGG